jgi:RNA polymerase sigma-70 factor (sigma-E family)
MRRGDFPLVTTKPRADASVSVMVGSEVLARPMGATGSPRDAALAALFHEHYAALVRLAALLVDDPGAAEEVVQEAFVGLFRRWDRLHDPAAAPGYLRATVVNRSRSRLRHRAVRRRHRAEALPDAPSAEAGALARDEEHAVLVAVARLPRRQRECLVLRYYLDLGQSETAAALGISEGSVKSHTHRALAALAAQLGEAE